MCKCGVPKSRITRFTPEFIQTLCIIEAVGWDQMSELSHPVTAKGRCHLEEAKSRSYYKKYRSLIIRRLQWGETSLNPSIVDMLTRYFEFSIETTQLGQLILLPYGGQTFKIDFYVSRKCEEIAEQTFNAIIKNLLVINVSHMGDKWTKRCAQVMLDTASWPPKSI